MHLVQLFLVCLSLSYLVGKGVADGVVAATPIVKDAASSATDAVASTTLPLLDTVGQAVDTSIVSPVQQAVDTSIMNPIQEAVGSVGTAINQALTIDARC